MMTFVPQDGTSSLEWVTPAVATGEGSAVIAGNTEGSLFGTNSGDGDFAAVKLDANGTIEWTWQVGKDTFKPELF